MCERNVGCLPHSRSDLLVPEALAQADSAECFWQRGLIPSSWTEVPEPPSETELVFTGINELKQGVVGAGSASIPIEIFGDASGGEDTSIRRFTRVGIAIVCVTSLLPCINIHGTVFGPLGGQRQVVARGELYALYLALWCTTRFLIFGDGL